VRGYVLLPGQLWASVVRFVGEVDPVLRDDLWSSRPPDRRARRSSPPRRRSAPPPRTSGARRPRIIPLFPPVSAAPRSVVSEPPTPAEAVRGNGLGDRGDRHGDPGRHHHPPRPARRSAGRFGRLLRPRRRPFAPVHLVGVVAGTERRGCGAPPGRPASTSRGSSQRGSPPSAGGRPRLRQLGDRLRALRGGRLRGLAAASGPGRRRRRVLFLGSMPPATQLDALAQSGARLVGRQHDRVHRLAAPPRWSRWSRAADVLFLNRAELAALSGLPAERWREAAAALCGRGRLRVVVVKAGPAGGACVAGDRVIERAAHPPGRWSIHRRRRRPRRRLPRRLRPRRPGPHRPPRGGPRRRPAPRRPGDLAVGPEGLLAAPGDTDEAEATAL